MTLRNIYDDIEKMISKDIINKYNTFDLFIKEIKKTEENTKNNILYENLDDL